MSSIIKFVQLIFAVIFVFGGINIMMHGGDASEGASFLLALGLIGLLICKAFKFMVKPELDSANRSVPTPDTHVKCPDCREFVLIDASVCKYCKCKLVPQM